MTHKAFRPTQLDLALAADPVAEAARIAFSVAAGEVYASSLPIPSRDAADNVSVSEQKHEAEKAAALKN